MKVIRKCHISISENLTRACVQVFVVVEGGACVQLIITWELEGHRSRCGNRESTFILCFKHTVTLRAIFTEKGIEQVVPDKSPVYCLIVQVAVLT